MTTLFWVSLGRAWEANPIMAYFLAQGAVPFITAKVATFAPALIAAEWYRPQNPVLIQRCMRWVIIVYLALYVAGVAGHQGHVVQFYRSLLLG